MGHYPCHGLLGISIMLCPTLIFQCYEALLSLLALCRSHHVIAMLFHFELQHEDIMVQNPEFSNACKEDVDKWCKKFIHQGQAKVGFKHFLMAEPLSTLKITSNF